MAGARAGVTYGGLVGLKESVAKSSTSVGLPGFTVLSFRNPEIPLAGLGAVSKDAFAGKFAGEVKPAADLGARIVGRASGPVAEKAVAAEAKKAAVYAGDEYPSMRAEFDRQNPDLHAGEFELGDKPGETGNSYVPSGVGLGGPVEGT